MPTTKRLVLCTGKVAYDLFDARDAAGDTRYADRPGRTDLSVPGRPLGRALRRMPALEDVVWAQEEPKNNGAWFFVEPYIEEALAAAKASVKRARYAGRMPSASPATGLAKRHQMEQAALVADALGHNVREEIRRTRKMFGKAGTQDRCVMCPREGGDPDWAPAFAGAH